MPDNTKTVRYNPLDPTLENLFMDMNVPSQPPRMKFNVRGYEGGGFSHDTLQGRAASCYVAVAKAINIGSVLLDRNVARAWLNKDPVWPRTSNVTVMPEAGKMWNAFYNRNSLRFFFNFDGIRQKMVYTSASARIVTHEAGHGLLDALRPDLWGYTNFEIWAFHEAFGDVLSIVLTLQDPQVAQFVLSQNGGNLREPNVVSGLAQEFGTAILQAPPGVSIPLRECCNDYKWVLPGILPPKAPSNELAAEPHSFSRIFSGACYEIMVRLWEKFRIEQGTNDVAALQKAANIMGSYFITASSLAAVNERFFDCVAKAMIFVDIQHAEVHRDILYSVFNDRKILQPTVIVGTQSVGHKYKGRVIQSCTKNALIRDNSEYVKLNNFISAQWNNSLSDIEVHVPMETFEVDGHPELSSISDKDRALDSAHTCVHWVNDQKKHEGTHSEFKIKDGRLVRKHFSCCFGR